MTKLIDAQSLPSDMRDELTNTFGMVPSFLRTLPPTEAKLWWSTLRDFQLSDQTALDGKVKELIGVGVAATIPCHYCVLFHTEAARLNGASEQELQEAIFMAGVTRLGSTVLNGSDMDKDTFDRELRDMMDHIKTQSQKAPAKKAAPVR